MSVNLRDIVKGKALMLRGAGIDPVEAAQNEFLYFYQKMPPHIFPGLSDHVAKDIEQIIATELTALLTTEN